MIISNKTFIVIFTILIIGAVAAGFLFFFKNELPKTPALSETKIPSSEELKAWIEIKKPRVMELSASGEILREFKTGDILSSGMTINSDLKGSAIIHFPDGSVARLDSETKLTIDEAKFEISNKTLTARLNLLTGRVWSKIIQLATPQSIWEVKTANAVATVRGTSFGVSFAKNKTNVVGLENKVAVSPRDPKTGETITSVQAIVEPEKLVIIPTVEIEKIKEQGEIEILEIKSAPAEIKTEIQAWVETNKTEDIEYEKIIETIKESRAENSKELRNEELQIEIQNKILEESKIKEEELKIEEIEQEPAEQKPVVQEQTKEQIIQTSPIPQKTSSEVKLIEVSGSFAKTVIEGEIIQFKAFAITSDTKRLDITNQVKWQVLGDIGTISISGKFQAQLIGAISEQGFSFGKVIATWRDPANGKEFLGVSENINVEATAPTDSIPPEERI